MPFRPLQPRQRAGIRKRNVKMSFELWFLGITETRGGVVLGRVTCSDRAVAGALECFPRQLN